MKKREQNRITDILCIIVFSAAVLAALSLLIMLISRNSSLFEWESFMDSSWVGISYSVVFLTTSLLSLLSDKNETIYWERFTEYVLVNPRIFNFYGLSCAAFVSIITETVAYLMHSLCLFWGSFFYGIIIIIVLYFKMSSIYFSRAAYIKKLELRRDSLTDEELSRLREFTLVGASNGNGRVVEENITFLLKYIYGKDNCTDENRKEYAKDVLYSTISSLENEKWIKQEISNNRELLSSMEFIRDLIFWIAESQKDDTLWIFLMDLIARNAGESLDFARSEIVNCLDVYAEENVTAVLKLMNFKAPENDEDIIKIGNYIRQYDYYLDYDDMDNEIERMNRCKILVSEYEKHFTMLTRYLIENNLWDEFALWLRIVLKRIDLIQASPDTVGLPDKNVWSVILSIVGDSTEVLSRVFACFVTVVHSLYGRDVNYLAFRDDYFVEAVMDRILASADYRSRLHDGFATYLLKNATEKMQKRYLIRLSAEEKTDDLYLVGGIASERRALLDLAIQYWYIDEEFGITSPADPEAARSLYEKEMGFWEDIIKSLRKDTDNGKQLQALMEKEIEDLKTDLETNMQRNL